MKRLRLLWPTALFLLAILVSSHAAPLKPRILVLTDISTWEPDDYESLIRLLVHADLFEIEGLVFTTGWSDTPAFLHVLPNGLNNPGIPAQAGWGGYSEWGLGPDEKTSAFTNHKGAAHAACDKYVRIIFAPTR